MARGRPPRGRRSPGRLARQHAPGRRRRSTVGVLPVDGGRPGGGGSPRRDRPGAGVRGRWSSVDRAVAGRARASDDVGCGSGVLSVSAALLGAASVTAVDVDKGAIVSTRANAARNGVGATVVASTTPAAELTGTFDVIVANIGAATLIELAPALQPRLAPRGWLGLSGLSPAQVSVVAAAYRPTRVIATPTRDDWAAVVVTPDG
ncbi:MAG: methyltransferase [Actinobacteria bacterium]|nr:MAG: methyltransferase [Actinomycetota bacterium]